MATVNFVHYRSQSRAALRKVADYVQRGDKTDEQRWVSGQNCSPPFVVEEFTAARMLHGKESPVWFYHYDQSFPPSENITPEQAHALAKEFAARAWPDSQVLIATHVDAAHIHSHFVVNAVCYESGMMLRQGPTTVKHLRRISDELCLQHGFSVLEPGRQKQIQGMSAREYRAAEKGQSWKFQLMYVIDDCMRRARSRREFVERMRERGYEVKWTEERKSITYTTPTGMRCRDIRLHDEKYLKEMMEREFRIREALFDRRAKAAQQAAGYGAADAAGGTSDNGGMGAVGGAGRGDQWTDAENRFSASQSGDTGADNGADRNDGYADNGGTGAGAAAPTGWEEERAALLSGLAFQKQTAGTVPDLATDGSGHRRGGGGVVRDLAKLGDALEHVFDAAPVNDTTTRPAHGDRKQLRREQEKKIAMGHKPDDHEDQQPTWQQQTMR